jgi:hypothetical protein
MSLLDNVIRGRWHFETHDGQMMVCKECPPYGPCVFEKMTYEEMRELFRPRTLEAKWLDPECWDGCQSLKFKKDTERLAFLKEKMVGVERFKDGSISPARWHCFIRGKNSYDLITTHIIGSGDSPEEAIDEAMKHHA